MSFIPSLKQRRSLQLLRKQRWEPVLRLVLRRALLRNVMVLLLLTVAGQRLVSHRMSRKTWLAAPIVHVQRKCPPPSYETHTPSTNITSVSNPKVCLVTLTDEKKKAWTTRYLGWRNFDGLLALTWNNKQEYAAKHGYFLFDESAALDTSRPPSWSKIRAVQRLLTVEQCDWVLWLDADTVIMNSEVQIEEFLPLASSDYYLLVSADNGGGYNAGAWLIRNTVWSRHFLDTWWSMRSFVRPPGFSHSGDNAALNALLAQAKKEKASDGSLSVFSQHVLVPARCTFNSFAKFLDPIEYDPATRLLEQQEWYKSEFYYHYGDFVAHVAGVDNKVETLQFLLALAT
jgi:hypothetical protein